MKLPIRILGTGCALPKRGVTTAELAAEALPHRDADWVIERIGIARRGWVETGTTHADLASRALSAALTDAGLPADRLRRIILVSTIGGDVRGPATSNLVAKELGIHGTAGCFDLNNACCGFVSGLDVAARLVATGEGPVGLVSAEVFSPHIRPSSPRPYLVMADAAAAVVLDAPRRDGAVLATDFANDGRGFAAVTLGHEADAEIVFGLSAPDITERARGDLVAGSTAVLQGAGLQRDEVDWVFPHQPNGVMLSMFMDILGYPMSRTRPIVREHGSVGATSVPLALHELWSDGSIRDGQHLLFAAVGAGTARATMLVRVERD
jgi:3-oxoacyl-[acyl-carrier-protein] synthase III